MARDLKIEALKDEINYGSMGIMAMAFFLTSNPLLFAIMAVFELTWMLFVPDTMWFKQRVVKKYEADDAKLAQGKHDDWEYELRSQISDPLRDRYDALKGYMSNITSATSQDTESTGGTYQNVANKASQLLDQFLKLSVQCTQNHHYIESVLAEGHIKVKPAKGEDEDDTDEAIWVQNAISAIVAYYQEQVKKIQKMVEDQKADPNSLGARTIQKQIQVISTRMNYISKIGESIVNINHNLALIESTLGLLSDQVHSGMPIGDSLDAVDETLFQADAVSKTLDEINPYQTVNAQ